MKLVPMDCSIRSRLPHIRISGALSVSLDLSARTSFRPVKKVTLEKAFISFR
jgi:hypothetical protein